MGPRGSIEQYFTCTPSRLVKEKLPGSVAQRLHVGKGKQNLFCEIQWRSVGKNYLKEIPIA